MVRKIALEEAFTLPSLTWRSASFVPSYRVDELNRQLLDIHSERLAQMNEHGIDFMVLSLTSPGPQDESDPIKAAALARESNDYLAAEVAKNPKRFGAFASLSMHEPVQAAEEARRAVRKLGCCGVIVNDFQSTNEGGVGEGALFYDQPEWDVFWKEMEELDVPLYIHPRLTTPKVSELFLKGREWLQASAYMFSFGMWKCCSFELCMWQTWWGGG